MKISIIGSGNVGSSTAFMIIQKQLGDVSLIDIRKGKAKGVALDIKHAKGYWLNNKFTIFGSSNFSDIKNSDIIVVTAGLPRKENMSRKDLISKNKKTILSISKEVVKNSPNSFFIIVTNPVDYMTYEFLKYTKIPKEKVVGMGSNLDTMRFKQLLSEKTNTPVNKIEAYVIGPHNDNMLPVLSMVKINKRSLEDTLKSKQILELVKKTKNSGLEIIKYSKDNSAYYAPSSAIIEILEIIILKKKKIIPVSTLLENKYGANDLCMGVPVLLQNKKINRIIEIPLSKIEKDSFKKAIKELKS